MPIEASLPIGTYLAWASVKHHPRPQQFGEKTSGFINVWDIHPDMINTLQAEVSASRCCSRLSKTREASSHGKQDG
jgi:hypothetical protein